MGEGRIPNYYSIPVISHVTTKKLYDISAVLLVLTCNANQWTDFYVMGNFGR